jgi:K+-sensing histidine kinase KdpD
MTAASSCSSGTPARVSTQAPSKSCSTPIYTTKAKGMGIGLSISRSIIERHAGRLWAEANEGPGATFSFCIPSAEVHASRA